MTYAMTNKVTSRLTNNYNSKIIKFIDTKINLPKALEANKHINS
jgi:hypothetical protein